MLTRYVNRFDIYKVVDKNSEEFLVEFMKSKKMMKLGLFLPERTLVTSFELCFCKESGWKRGI